MTRKYRILFIPGKLVTIMLYKVIKELKLPSISKTLRFLVKKEFNRLAKKNNKTYFEFLEIAEKEFKESKSDKSKSE